MEHVTALIHWRVRGNMVGTEHLKTLLLVSFQKLLKQGLMYLPLHIHGGWM
jgi:hypothetical protein